MRPALQAPAWLSGDGIFFAGTLPAIQKAAVVGACFRSMAKMPKKISASSAKLANSRTQRH